MNKSRLKEALLSRLPPLPTVRATLKASVALTVSLICVLAKPTRDAIGNASTLATLGTLLYFPIKPIGSHLKTTFYGIISIVIGAAWCFLGNYVANIARDSSVDSAMQPSSSGISALFCIILVFSIAYVRTKYPQVQFGTVFAGMIGSFALTQNAALPGFQPSVTMAFVMPLIFSTAISLAVNILLWPEDDTTKYFTAFTELIKDYKIFLQESATTFCNKYPSSMLSSTTIPIPIHLPSTAMTLPTLRTKLQKSLIKLEDTQHEIDHVPLYSQLSQHDMKHLTQLVKKIRAPLHGIGISLLMKGETHMGNIRTEYDAEYREQSPFSNESNKASTLITELVASCILAMDECEQRVQRYKQPDRSFISTFCWPFARLVRTTIDNPTLSMSSQKLRSLIATYSNSVKEYTSKTNENVPTSSKHNNGAQATIVASYARDLDSFFKFNLIGAADSICSLIEKLEQFEHSKSKKHRRFWIPRTSKRCLKPSNCSKPQFGGQISQQLSSAASPILSDSGSSFVTTTSATSNTNVNTSQVELNKTIPASYDSTATTIDMDNGATENTVSLDNLPLIKLNISKPCPRDPDADAPITATEKLFQLLSRVTHWFYSMETAFAIKTSAGFILLSLPAYLPQSVGWFTYWGGQWVANTLLMWMIPMAGLFNFTILLGLLGSVAGAVASIVVWEISQANPYGIAILSFVVFVGCHYIFFTKQLYSYTAIMTLYTFLMVITFTYQSAVGSPVQHDDIWLTTGKRLLFVCLGIISSFIVNLIPRPVTGRVELRLRISRTIHDLSILYGTIFTTILDGHPLSAPQKNKVRQFTLYVQRQLKDEETFLKYSKLEPPLKGKFPYDTYQRLLEKLNNMADLMEGMAYTSQSFLMTLTGSTNRGWRKNLLQALYEPHSNSDIHGGRDGNVDYIVCVQSIMRQLSSSLKSKLPLPPYMILPDELCNKVSYILDSAFLLDADTVPDRGSHMKDAGFSAYRAFSIATTLFIQELNEAAVCVENLVGVENPQIWLTRYA